MPVCAGCEDMESTEPQVSRSMGLRSFSSLYKAEETAYRAKPPLSHLFSRNPRREASEVDKKVCSEEGFAAVSQLLRHQPDTRNSGLRLWTRDEEKEATGKASRRRTGFLAFTGGLSNALHIFGEALDHGRYHGESRQHMSRAAQWFKKGNVAIDAKAIVVRRTCQVSRMLWRSKRFGPPNRRCKYCGFLSECAAASNNTPPGLFQ